MKFRRTGAVKKPLPDRVNLNVLRLSHDGRGIAERDGRVVMVSGALPGEQVIAKIEKGNTKLWQGKTVELLNQSPERIKPPCKVFSQCGGCQLQHMSLDGQHQVKKQAVTDHFKRNNIDLPEVVDLISLTSFEYRHRARLHVSSSGQLGFHAEQGNKVVAFASCAIFTPALTEAVSQLTSQAPLKGMKQLEVAVDDFGKIGLKAIKGRPEAVEALNSWAEESQWVVGKPLNYQAGSKTVMANPGGFTQVNRAVNQKMLETGANWLGLDKSDRLLDLFCGSGNVAYFMKDQVSAVVGLEASEDAISQAIAVRETDLHCQFEVSDLFTEDISNLSLVRELNPNVAVLDPPRAGAELVSKNIKHLSSLNKILYISCDPATLARDVKIIKQANWHLSKLALVDMFPQTKHVETMVLLEKL